MDSILRKWKKKGISNPQQVEEEQAQFAKSKDEKNSERLQSAPTYDLSEYEKYANDNTDI